MEQPLGSWLETSVPPSSGLRAAQTPAFIRVRRGTSPGQRRVLCDIRRHAAAAAACEAGCAGGWVGDASDGGVLHGVPSCIPSSVQGRAKRGLGSLVPQTRSFRHALAFTTHSRALW
eukprot:365299-Chlamydomonas_euryale.AAC.13